VTGIRSDDETTGRRTLEFSVLGPVEARRDGTRVDLGSRKQRAVLAVLLLNANRVVSAERLIDELWGATPPGTARSALQVYVAGLRKALGGDAASLRTVAPGYLLALEPGSTDLDRFEALRAAARTSGDDEQAAALLHDALALWRDRPLADLDGEPFAEEAGARLDELRLAALEERIDADLALGRHSTLVAELDALVAEHPYRERFRRQLMLALYRSGRQADALAAYWAAREASIEGLGLEPGPELRALERAVLEQDPALAPPPVAPPTPPARDEHRHPRRRWLWALPAFVVAAAAVATAALVLDRDPAPISAPPNSVAVIDPATNRVDAVVPGVGIRPGPIAFGAGSVWVGSLEGRRLDRIDPGTRQVTATVPLPATPTGVAYGFGAVWVAHGRLGGVSRIDPQFNRRTRTVRVTTRALYFPDGSVSTGEGSVWAVFGNSTLVSLDPGDLDRTASTQAGVGVGPAAVAVGFGSVWLANSGDSTVGRFNPMTFEEGNLDEYTVGLTPRGLAIGVDAVWVASSGDDSATRIDPLTGARHDVEVGDGPAAIAAGGDSVWVANRGDGTVSRIDPETRKVVAEISVGGAPSGIAVADGAVWVSVQAP
jgi:YVTN family beta-propeller protein